MDKNIKLRNACQSDAKIVYEWRNHISVRRNSFSQEEIGWREHLVWFEKVLASKKQCILIGILNEEAFGVVRFDLATDCSRATINIYLDPKKQGNGLGEKLLDNAISWAKYKLNIKVVDAEILVANGASKHLFEKQGFRIVSYCFSKIIK